MGKEMMRQAVSRNDSSEHGVQIRALQLSSYRAMRLHCFISGRRICDIVPNRLARGAICQADTYFRGIQPVMIRLDRAIQISIFGDVANGAGQRVGPSDARTMILARPSR